MGWVAGTFTKWRSRRTLAALAVVAVAAALVVIPTQTASAANPIANENSRPGTPGWQITKVASSFQISGYVTQPAVDPGDPVPVHVNLKAPEANHDYTVEVYRMGYYGGVGARRWFGPKTLSFGNPLADPTQVDVATGRIEADWPTAFTVDTTGYVTGTYLVRLTSVNGWQAYVPFTVRSATPTTYQFLNAPDVAGVQRRRWQLAIRAQRRLPEPAQELLPVLVPVPVERPRHLEAGAVGHAAAHETDGLPGDVPAAVHAGLALQRRQR